MTRPSGRTIDALRSVSLEPSVSLHAEGSCFAKFGNTHVLCTASIEERVPAFLRNSGKGWVTAEYGMLPRSTHSRIDRESARGKQGGHLVCRVQIRGRCGYGLNVATYHIQRLPSPCRYCAKIRGRARQLTLCTGHACCQIWQSMILRHEAKPMVQVKQSEARQGRGRALDALRSVSLEPSVSLHAEGSCFAKFGNTHVLCTASIDERVPGFLRNSGKGWVTAEYGMLPRSTHSRIDRESARGKQGGHLVCRVQIRGRCGYGLNVATYHIQRLPSPCRYCAKMRGRALQLMPCKVHAYCQIWQSMILRHEVIQMVQVKQSEARQWCGRKGVS